MRNILIFGGSGFIGTHYSKKYIAEGDRVYNIDINPSRFENENLFYIKHDVRDLSALELDVKIDVIYNFAAVHTTPGHPTHEYYETNVLGASNVCAFAELNNITEVVFTSSISVYGPEEQQKDECSPLTPNSAYGYSKMLAENIHQAWKSRCNTRILTIIRPAVVFGPGEGGNFTRLASIMNKGFFIYPGRKDTIKACIYVDDLIYIVERARWTENAFELLNGAYEERYTLEQIVYTFRKDHFPRAKTFMVPKFIVISAAKFFGAVNIFNIGIHPERVMKLIKSTNIYPGWIVRNKIILPCNLESALKRWSDETDGRFD